MATEQVLNTDGLVVFSDDWGRHPSSSQHLIMHLRDHHNILWVNTIGTRTPSVDGFTLFRGSEKLRNWGRGLRRCHENMWVVDAPMLPSIGSRLSRRISTFLVTNYVKICLKRIGIRRPTILTSLPHISWLLGDINQTQTIYYCTDDYSSWCEADTEALLESEKELVAKSSCVLVVSKKLQVRFSSVSKIVEFFPHAVDYEHFASASQKSNAVESTLESPQKRVGYFGLVYEKLDFDLLIKVANAIFPRNLVMIGPVDYCDATFSKLQNVIFTGKKSYEELPKWLSDIDVLLLPYIQEDEMIKNSSPLKLRECLATGKPTVSVDVPEVRRYIPHVFVANSQEDFVLNVLNCLRSKEVDSTIQARQQSVQNDTWKQRAEKLESYFAVKS